MTTNDIDPNLRRLLEQGGKTLKVDLETLHILASSIAAARLPDNSVCSWAYLATLVDLLSVLVARIRGLTRDQHATCISESWDVLREKPAAVPKPYGEA